MVKNRSLIIMPGISLLIQYIIAVNYNDNNISGFSFLLSSIIVWITCVILVILKYRKKKKLEEIENGNV